MAAGDELKFEDLPSDIDPLIKPVVIAFNKKGFDTFSSCQGGDGHLKSLPWIRIVPKQSPRESRKEIAAWLFANGITACDIHEVYSGIYSSVRMPERCFVDVFFWSIDEAKKTYE